MAKFRVALSGDFLKSDGTPAYPMVDLAPLAAAGGEVAYVHSVDRVMRAADLEGFDALILLGSRFDARSIPADGRLAVVARFGVGYDTVDVAACTKAGIALVITPDGVRRPVAVTVLTLMLALASRLFAKDRITRMGPQGWAMRSDYMGLGLTGRTLGLLGVGNIGAEVLRLAAPLDMRFIAHDPYIDPAKARALGADLVDLDTLFRESDFVSINVPLGDRTRGLVGARLFGLMKPTAYLINTARGPIVDQRALHEVLASRPHRRGRARRLRGRAGAGRRADPQARQRHRHPARALLHRRVLRRQRRRRRPRRALGHARRDPGKPRQSGGRRDTGVAPAPGGASHARRECVAVIPAGAKRRAGIHGSAGVGPG